MELITPQDKQKLIAELEKKDFTFKAYMFGLDDDIEKAIIHYINKEGGITIYQNLLIKFVYKDTIVSKNRLQKRLESLTKNNYLNKKEEETTIQNKKITNIFYTIKNDE